MSKIAEINKVHEYQELYFKLLLPKFQEVAAGCDHLRWSQRLNQIYEQHFILLSGNSIF